MRVSIDDSDVEGMAGFMDIMTKHGPTVEIKVFLDDILQPYCVTADTDAGVVERLKTDADGHFVVSGDEVAREQLHGQVRIEF